jgi:hypothetical protein
LYSIAKNAEAISESDINSYMRENGCCFVIPGGLGLEVPSYYWPATDNDPAVTGISTATLALPITIEPKP